MLVWCIERPLIKHINVELNVYEQCNCYRREAEMRQDATSMWCITLSHSSVAAHEGISSIFWGSLKARGLRLVARSAGGLTFWQHHPPHYDHNHEPHIHDRHQCDHKHHLNTSTTQLQTPIQKWTPTEMWLWTEQKHQCEHRYHPVHEVSHNVCASNACQQPNDTHHS